MRGGEAESAQPRYRYTYSTPDWGIPTTSPMVEKLLSWREYR